jgi:hypothetical protein
MKVRAILLALALCLGLATVSPAKTRTKPHVVGSPKAKAAARRNAKKQMKFSHKAKRTRPAVRRPAKH